MDQIERIFIPFRQELLNVDTVLDSTTTAMIAGETDARIPAVGFCVETEAFQEAGGIGRDVDCGADFLVEGEFF